VLAYIPFLTPLRHVKYRLSSSLHSSSLVRHFFSVNAVTQTPVARVVRPDPHQPPWCNAANFLVDAHISNESSTIQYLIWKEFNFESVIHVLADNTPYMFNPLGRTISKGPTIVGSPPFRSALTTKKVPFYEKLWWYLFCLRQWTASEIPIWHNTVFVLKPHIPRCQLVPWEQMHLQLTKIFVWT